MSTFAEKMAAARPAERTVAICLRADLVAELENLERQAEEARTAARSTASKEDTGPAAIVERIRELQAAMRDDTETFRLRALPPRRYRALREAHPPRRDDAGEINAGDQALGFNRDTMLPELARQCVVTPKLTDEQWRDLVGDSETEAARLAAEGKTADVVDGLLTFRQWVDLMNAAYELNEGEIDVPFSPAALLMSRTTGDE